MNTSLIGWWFGEIEPEELGIYIVKHTCDYNLLEQQLRLCADTFARTIAAKSILEHNNGEFNWGDVVTYIPESFLKTFGIESIDLGYDWRHPMFVVNHDEKLTDFDYESALRLGEYATYRVEYDLAYYGGDYDHTGSFVDVEPDPGESVEHAFERIYGYNRCHIINYDYKENEDEE